MTKTHHTTDHIKDIALFSACTSQELKLIAGTTTELRYSAGDVLAQEGRYGHEFMVIVDGRARVEIAGHQIAVLDAGDFFGELALLDGGTRTATVTADSDLVVEVIAQREFDGLLLAAPHLARSILIGVARRLRAADLLLTV
jgi:CRP-like cAMP-binding protein